MNEYVIGFDLGGTRLKSGAVTRNGELVTEGIQPSGYQMVPERLVRACTEEVERITTSMGGHPEGIGIALSGAVHPRKGVVLLPGKMKGLEGYPLVPELETLLGIPVIAENDGRTSMYAEYYYGKARTFDWAVTITIGTGVGSGVLLDGRILRDPHLQFGTQMGHTILQAGSGRLCITGARGTAEMMCSATALMMAVREALQRGIPSLLSDRYFENPTFVDFKAIIEAVESNDPLCTDELRHWRTNLGWLLVSVAHAYSPEIIILSGGATNASAHFLTALQEHLDDHVFRYPVGKPVPIVLSDLRDHSGVLGAAARAWEHLGEYED